MSSFLKPHCVMSATQGAMATNAVIQSPGTATNVTSVNNFAGIFGAVFHFSLGRSMILYGSRLTRSKNTVGKSALKRD